MDGHSKETSRSVRQRRTLATLVGAASLSGIAMVGATPYPAAAASELGLTAVEPAITSVIGKPYIPSKQMEDPENDHGCKVRVYRVNDASANNGDKWMDTKVELHCKAHPNRRVRFKAELWEADNGHGKFGDCGKEDDRVGEFFPTSSWSRPDGVWQTVSYKYPKKVKKSYECAGDRRGEFYQKVWIKVQLDGEDEEKWSHVTAGNTRTIRVV